MTSERKRRANRINAQASTGPKTAKGKKRSALNARGHGLNTSVLQDPFWGPVADKELEELAQRFAGSSRSPSVLAHARGAAEAHLDVQRVRACRDRLVEKALADPNFVGIATEALKLHLSMRWIQLAQSGRTGFFPEHGFAYLRPQPLEGPQKLASILCDLVRHLKGLKRYERRALSRFKSALRHLDAALRDEREQKAEGAGDMAGAPVLH